MMVGHVARRAAGAGGRKAWRALRLPVLETVNLSLAVIILFEEWGWRPLAEIVARLRRFQLWSRLELWVQDLPPYGALCVFALPTGLLFPLKLAALWLVANGHPLLAAALFIFAKLIGTALLARLFTLTQEALMRIGWFARLYNLFVPWQQAMFAQIRSSWAWRYGRILKDRIRQTVEQAWASGEQTIAALWPQLGVAWAGANRRGRRVAARLKALYATNSSRR